MSKATLKRVSFTPAQQQAMLHRLDLSDSFPQVFEDTDGLEHLADRAEARVKAIAKQLTDEGFVDVNLDELDKEILSEAIAGSTWVAVNDPEGDTRNTPQAKGAALRALRGARQTIAETFGMGVDEIDIPEG